MSFHVPRGHEAMAMENALESCITSAYRHVPATLRAQVSTCLNCSNSSRDHNDIVDLTFQIRKRKRGGQRPEDVGFNEVVQPKQDFIGDLMSSKVDRTRENDRYHQSIGKGLGPLR